jgi:hypothetical protein
MAGESDAPRARQLSAPARHTGAYGLRWRARDTWRGARWRARERPLWLIGVTWCAIGALMILSSFAVPGAGPGPAWLGAVITVAGALATRLKSGWSR